MNILHVSINCSSGRWMGFDSQQFPGIAPKKKKKPPEVEQETTQSTPRNIT